MRLVRCDRAVIGEPANPNVWNVRVCNVYRGFLSAITNHGSLMRPALEEDHRPQVPNGNSEAFTVKRPSDL